MFSSEAGKLDIVRFLIESGASLDLSDQVDHAIGFV
jgi:hypothetical protein